MNRPIVNLQFASVCGSRLRWLNDDRLTDLEFADDIALIDESVTQVQEIIVGELTVVPVHPLWD